RFMPNKAMIATASTVPNGTVTLVSSIVDRLRFEILGGRIKPGAKLRADDLKNKFEVSLTPVREALMRLSAEGLVIAEDQRGFRVAPISLQNLKEVTELRVALECLALQHAIAAGDLEWETNIVATAHRLGALTSRPSNDQAVINEEWEEWHRKFHVALIAACNMPLLIAFCKTANDLCDRYRRIFLPFIRPIDRLNDHNRIAEATCKRDSALATKLLADHIRKTEVVIIAGVKATPNALQAVERPSLSGGAKAKPDVKRPRAAARRRGALPRKTRVQ
ncbi:MAG TPA: GntR family transcriptional regulator, partial [Steroidobacteraceae bacterium]|nr:GntR family transcriptional regulator [Steroidobacteraceae bacterium]